MKHQQPLLSDLAYERILEALFDARLPMGARLSQTDLTRLTGIPVGPVRDALRVLEADGIVTIHPRSGIQVIPASTELVRSTYQFRTMIERPAARAFSQRAPEALLHRLIALHDAMAADLGTLDPGTSVGDRLDRMEIEFHTPIVAAFGNELIDASYRRLQLMSRIIKVSGVVYPRAALISIDEHRDILTACLNRDPEAAEAAMARHLSNALSRNLGMG
jgi:DNA-binding GntR family transcriptional regulator